MAKQRFIEWELENTPEVYKKPRCNEFIDRQTLTHIICNVACPEGVEYEVFTKVLNEVAETLELFPYFKVREQCPVDLQLLEDAGFEL